MRQHIADILVYDTKRNLVLTVVTMKMFGKSREWAAQMRHNLYENEEGSLPKKCPFFLLALADHFYLWKNVEDEGLVMPTYDMDPRFSIEPYFKKSGYPLEKLNRESFELLVGFWLSGVTLAYEENDICSLDSKWLSKPYHEWLFESGLFNVIKRGLVEHL